MPLNKASGNMYNWISHTFNLVKGQCPHMCQYCYCKRWGKQSELHFDESELKTDLGKGNKIFVGSSCDMWADKIPQLWIDKTLEHIGNFRCNNYIIQSKNPMRIYENRNRLPAIPFWIGTTVESNFDYLDIDLNAPPINNRILAMTYLERDFNTFLTIEPIMQFSIDRLVTLIFNCHPKFVNIGADTGNNHLPEPSKEKILELIGELRKFTEIRLKKNLTRLMEGNNGY